MNETKVLLVEIEHLLATISNMDRAIFDLERKLKGMMQRLADNLPNETEDLLERKKEVLAEIEKAKLNNSDDLELYFLELYFLELELEPINDFL